MEPISQTGKQGTAQANSEGSVNVALIKGPLRPSPEGTCGVPTLGSMGLSGRRGETVTTPTFHHPKQQNNSLPPWDPCPVTAPTPRQSWECRRGQTPLPPAAAPPPPLPGTEGARSERPARAAVLLAVGARLAPRPLPPGCAGTKSGQRTRGEAGKGAAPAQLLGRQGVPPPRSGPPGDSSEWGPDRPKAPDLSQGRFQSAALLQLGFSCLPRPPAELLHPKYA